MSNRIFKMKKLKYLREIWILFAIVVIVVMLPVFVTIFIKALTNDPHPKQSFIITWTWHSTEKILCGAFCLFYYRFLMMLWPTLCLEISSDSPIADWTHLPTFIAMFMIYIWCLHNTRVELVVVSPKYCKIFA